MGGPDLATPVLLDLGGLVRLLGMLQTPYVRIDATIVEEDLTINTNAQMKNKAEATTYATALLPKRMRACAETVIIAARRRTIPQIS